MAARSFAIRHQCHLPTTSGCASGRALAGEHSRPVWIRGGAKRIDVTAVEEEGFWCWAVVETLRHTGIRIEELLELTQLSLRHYTAPTTGTLVPLLAHRPEQDRLRTAHPDEPGTGPGTARRATTSQSRQRPCAAVDPLRHK